MARRWLASMASLYAVQAANVILPLATMPLLARVLGPHEWGGVALAQAIAINIALVIDFGFTMSATRDAARAVGDGARLSALAAGVMGAKALLALPTALVATVVALLFLPVVTPAMLAAALVWGVVQGLHPGWLLQGLERLRLCAAIDVAARLGVAAAILLLVRAPGDGWIAVAAYAAGWVVTTIAGSAIALRLVRMRRPRWGDVRAALSHGGTIFAHRVSVAAYSTANALLLGLLALPSAVACWAGSERLVRTPLNLLWPAVQALYPHVNRLSRDDPSAARRTTLRTLTVLVGAAALAGTVIACAAPLIVAILLGPAYAEAVPVLRTLALLPPMVAASTVLGTQVLLPAGRDRAFTGIALTAGAVNILGALAFAPRWGAVGMAWSVVATEACVLALQLRHALPLLRAAPTVSAQLSPRPGA